MGLQAWCLVNHGGLWSSVKITLVGMPHTYQVTIYSGLRAFNIQSIFSDKWRKSVSDSEKLNEGRQKLSFVTAWFSTLLTEVRYFSEISRYFASSLNSYASCWKPSQRFFFLSYFPNFVSDYLDYERNTVLLKAIEKVV